MTQLNAPLGCVPIQNANGSFPKITEYVSVTSSTYFKGMIVCLNTTNGLAKTPTTTSMLAGNMIGIVSEYKNISGTATGDDLKIKVFDDPDVLFEMQANAALTNRATYLTKFFDIANLQTGSTTTLQSKGEIDVASAAAISASTAVVVQILRPVKTIGTTSNLEDSRYVCRFTQPYHFYGLSGLGTEATTALYLPLT